MPRESVPGRGDLVWLQFHPQAGHEHPGRRPALVLSPRAYNKKVGLALCCPVTSRIKGYPFEVVLPEGGPATGAILCDQIKSLDWSARKAERICALPEETLADVMGKALALLR